MTDGLSRVFAALADPSRRAILARLTKGEATVTELARPLLKEMSLPAVTKHLQVLERAGLVRKSRQAQRRPCRFDAAPLREAVDWMEHCRIEWEARLDRLGEFLAKKAGGTRGQRK